MPFLPLCSALSISPSVTAIFPREKSQQIQGQIRFLPVGRPNRSMDRFTLGGALSTRVISRNKLDERIRLMICKDLFAGNFFLLEHTQKVDGHLSVVSERTDGKQFQSKTS